MYFAHNLCITQIIDKIPRGVRIYFIYLYTEMCVYKWDK